LSPSDHPERNDQRRRTGCDHRGALGDDELDQGHARHDGGKDADQHSASKGEDPDLHGADERLDRHQ
jgi:hypothetical protein